MPRTLLGRKRRAQAVKVRASGNLVNRFPRCTIIGCGKSTAGLAIALCRKHLLHRQRHGSPFCKSPNAKLLGPYLKASLAVLKVQRNEPYISAALAGLHDVMASAGQVIPAIRLNGLPPAERARIALARLRDAGIKPERLLAIALAVHALIRHDPAKTHNVKDWRIVAVAKAAHRLASGYHRVWEVRDDTGRIVQHTEMHAYPRSSGRVLRYLGEAIEKECEWVIEKYLDEVISKISVSTTPRSVPCISKA